MRHGGMGVRRTGDFVCRVEINAAGLAVYGGTKGGKRIADVSWERLVHKLSAQTRQVRAKGRR
jgi:hypothetical protein